MAGNTEFTLQKFVAAGYISRSKLKTKEIKKLAELGLPEGSKYKYKAETKSSTKAKTDTEGSRFDENADLSKVSEEDKNNRLRKLLSKATTGFAKEVLNIQDEEKKATQKRQKTAAAPQVQMEADANPNSAEDDAAKQSS